MKLTHVFLALLSTLSFSFTSAVLDVGLRLLFNKGQTGDFCSMDEMENVKTKVFKAMSCFYDGKGVNQRSLRSQQAERKLGCDPWCKKPCLGWECMCWWQYPRCYGCQFQYRCKRRDLQEEDTSLEVEDNIGLEFMGDLQDQDDTSLTVQGDTSLTVMEDDISLALQQPEDDRELQDTTEDICPDLSTIRTAYKKCHAMIRSVQVALIQALKETKLTKECMRLFYRTIYVSCIRVQE